MVTHASANAYDSSFIIPTLRDNIQSVMGNFFDKTGPATPQQQSMTQIAQQLRSGPGGVTAVKAYFGDSAEPMLAILDSHADLTDPQQFDMVRQQWQRGKLATPSAQEKKDALTYITGQDSHWWNPFSRGALSGWNVTDGAKAALAPQIAEQMAQKQRAFGLSPDDAARAAFMQVMGDYDLVPGALIAEDRGKWGKGQSWRDYVNRVPAAAVSQDQPLYHDTMRSYINDLATEAIKRSGKADMSNFDPSDYHVQYGTYLGNGLMNLYLQKADGSPLNVTMQADEFGKRIATAVQSRSYGANGSKAPQGMPEKNAFGWGY